MSLKVDYKQKTALLFHMPAIVLLTLITMVPLIYNIRISFYDFSLTSPGGRDIFVGLENYKMILSDYPIQSKKEDKLKGAPFAQEVGGEFLTVRILR